MISRTQGLQGLKSNEGKQTAPGKNRVRVADICRLTYANTRKDTAGGYREVIDTGRQQAASHGASHAERGALSPVGRAT